MENNLSRITSIDNGAKFYKVDLHFHTPESHDYKDKSISYESIVDKAIENGLDMVAVTDHHIGTGYEKLREAAKGKKLVVLPGVEINVGNIHLLAIFKENTSSSEIRYLLHRISIKDEDFGKKDIIVDVKYSIPDVLDEINKLEGIPIAAHVDSSSGLTNRIRGKLRKALVQYETLKVIEITKIETAKFFDGTDPNYRKKLTCIRGSDSHHINEIGHRATWIKMSECSFRGLKQIIYEPELRISLEEPTDTRYPRIVGMSLTGGLYKDEIFHFNRNMNCLIGGRGAGKSAVLDFIRFVLDYPPRSAALLKDFNGKMANLLGIGNSVFLYVENENGIFLIERKLVEYEEDKISGKSEKINNLISDLKISKIFNDGLMEEDFRELRSIIEIEVFGQGEVFELTRQADDQLKLIDEYIGSKELFETEKEFYLQLEENAEEIIKLKEEKKVLDEKMEGLGELKTKVNDITEQLKDETLIKHNLWQMENRFFKEVKENIINEMKLIESSVKETICPELPDIISENTPNLTELKKVKDIFGNIYIDLKNSRKKGIDLLNEAYNKIEELYILWKKGFDEEENRFRELGEPNKEILSKKLTKLKDEEFKLESKEKPKLEEIRKKIVDKNQKRAALLDNLESTRKFINEQRVDIINKMSQELERGDVKIEISHNSNRIKFFKLLYRIYRGSNIKNQDEQYQKICKTINPIDLAGIITEGRMEDLKSRSDITDDTAKKIIDNAREEDIYKIQICPIQDELEIFLRKAKGEGFTPLKDLSYGEKCTAIFSIALLGKEKPLLVDQPEDELDHAFIIDNIIEHIRNVKESRQLIIATHNANIPVLGDAELILKVTKIPGQENCKIEERGGFEKEAIIDKLQGLEGGPDAFRRRKEKYGIQ